MLLRKTSRDEFVAAITTSKEDAFAKTFVAKADMQEQWDECIGCWENNDLMGAIIVTISKRKPHIANLQLLHTFSKFRKRGVAKYLCESMLCYVIGEDAEYMRVSAEPEAVDFYKKIGMVFLGIQKSGCSLSIFKINGYKYSDGLYDMQDPVIKKAVYRKGKGGCTQLIDS